MSGPLVGVRVLDLSRVMAGPWSTQIFADLGADVIKVERTGEGDDTRGWGPPFLPGTSEGAGANSGYYLSVNRGKRSIEADLSDPKGQALVKELVKTSDIVVENYKVGALKRWGLDYDSLAAINPKIIYCSITGFGQDGPRASQAAYDFIIQAMGGLMSVTGERDGQPGGGPQKVGVPIVDIMTGMYSAVAVLAALARRNLTGQGERIDVAMLDVQTAFLANQAMNFLMTGKPGGRNGNRHPNIQPQNVYPCGEGYMALAVGNDGQFVKLCDVLGVPEAAQDERFKLNASRVRNLAAMEEIILERLATADAGTWVDRLEAAGVPAGRINNVAQVFEEPQVQHRQMLRDLPHPTAGTVPSVVSPMRFASAPLTYDRAPPLLGQHTEEILRELNLTEPR